MLTAALKSAPVLAPELKHLRPIRFKAETVSEAGTFEGYGNVFGVVDSYGDIVMPGAFSASLAEYAAQGTLPKLLLQHDPAAPIGVWTEMREDQHGLFCKGQLNLDVERARETLSLMRQGALDGLSIGGDPVDTQKVYVDALADHGIVLQPEELELGGQRRLVYGWDLWEVSVVTFPACKPSLIDTETVKRRPHAHTSRRHASLVELDRLARAVARRGRLLAALR
jgi:HK97 family phage prohead protease